MKGQPPKPTVLKKLQGNPGKKALPKNEPEFEKLAGIPDAPDFLSKPAQNEWRRAAAELYPVGLLTKVSIPALEMYCMEYAVWFEAQENLQKHGFLMKSPTGFPMQSPYLAIMNRAMVESRKWMQEFGATPSSQARVSVKPVKKDDPVEAFRKARLKRVK
jgi:P27 family predicted phage terminase small subunit